MPIIKIHNVETNEVIEREMNAQELVQWEIDKAAIEAKGQSATKAVIAKTALLEKLGITDEEAKLLLGGN